MNKWRSSEWGAVGITLLATMIRLYQLGVSSLWYDESFSYIMTARLPLWDSVQAMITSAINPPLFYLLPRPWVMLTGSSEYAFRFLAAATGILAVPALYALGNQLRNKLLGLVAALLLTINPFHVWYSRDARMYAPVAFFSIAAMSCFVSLARGQRRWIAFAVWSALAYLTHYGAFALLYVQLIYLLPRLAQRQLVRRWFLAQVAALLPLAPFLVAYVLYHGLRPAGLTWIPSPSPLAPLYTVWNFTLADVETFAPWVAVSLIAVAAILLAGWMTFREWWLLFWWFVLPIGLTFLISLRRSYYVDRYLIASLPAYLLLLALGIMARRKVWRLVTAAIVIGAMSWATSRLYTDPAFAREDWRGASTAIERGLERGDTVVLQDAETLVGTTYYRREVWPYIVLETGRETAMLDEAMARSRRVWLVWRNTDESNHRLSKSEPFDMFQSAAAPVRDWLASRRDRIALDLRLPGLGVVRFDLEKP